MKTGQKTRHKVRRGETLAAIAGRYHTTADAIRRWNGLSGGSPAAGRVLIIYYGTK